MNKPIKSKTIHTAGLFLDLANFDYRYRKISNLNSMAINKASGVDASRYSKENE